MPTRTSRRLVRRRPVMRRRKMMRKKITNVPDVASCSVSFQVSGVYTNTAYNYETFRLSDSDRASAIARGYQQYRICNVRVTWKPLYDTYAPGVTQTKPVLYYIVDRARAVADNFTISTLKEMGVRPRALDEKPIQVHFKPGVLLDSDTATAPASLVRYAPWLSTNANTTVAGASWGPSAVNHEGIKFFIESADGGTSTPVQLTLEYQIQFKKPNWSVSTGAPAQGLVLN